MSEAHWTETYTGWPAAAQQFILAAEDAHDQGRAAAKSGTNDYAAPAWANAEQGTSLVYVYASARLANTMLGSAAKNQAESDAADKRRVMFRLEAGRAITKGLTDGAAGAAQQYEPLEQWYSGPEVSYLNMLKTMYAEAYSIGMSMTPRPVDASSGWLPVLGGFALVAGAVGLVGMALTSPRPRARSGE